MEHIILQFFTYLIECFIFFSYCSAIFQRKYAGRSTLCLFLCSYGILLLMSFWIDNFSTLFFYFTINFILLFFFFRTELSAALIYSLINICILKLCNFCIQSLISPYTLSLYEKKTSIINYFLFMVTEKSLYFLLLNLIIYFLNRHRYYKDLQLKFQRENNFTEYYRKKLQQNEVQQILIHDTKKHLQTIDLLNQKGEQEKISQYISQIVDSSKLQEPSFICDHELLNMILCHYREKCREHKIRFSADIRSKVLLFMEESDLTSLICNLLDNAIEAAINCPDPLIELNIRIKEKTSINVLTLENSCIESPFTSNSEKLISAKRNRKIHGFGMKSIHRVVEKYQGHIHMHYEEESHTFHTTIILKDLPKI